MSSPAEIVLDRRDGSIVARLNGEVDMSNASYVRDQLLASMPNEALALVLDITAAATWTRRPSRCSSRCRAGSAGAARSFGS